MDKHEPSSDELWAEISTDEYIREMDASIREARAREPELLREKSQNAEAVEVAGMYLKQAAIALAKEALSDPWIHNADDLIARIETILRAARHVRRIANHDGDLVPAIQRLDGSRISLVIRLIEVMGRDRVILADQTDDPKSKSKANKAIREAREEIKKVAHQVLREGEIIA